MKNKAYICPAIRVRQLEADSLLAASAEGEDVSITIDDQNGTYSGDFYSKQHNSIWDDNDEEE